MHRSILAGLFAFSLTFGSWSIAFAGDPALPQSDQAAGAATLITSAGTAQAASTSDKPAVPYAASVLGKAIAPEAEPEFDSAGSPDVSSTIPAAAPFKPVLIRPTAQDRPASRLRRFAGTIARRTSAIASSLTRSAMRFLGVPYVFGGTQVTGFDCSGYVQHVFGMHGLHLPRTADAQFDAAHRIRTPMTAGDLVFFHTYAPGVSHVGIYLGQSRFIHASSSRGVAVSSLHNSYWAPRYIGAKRVVGS